MRQQFGNGKTCVSYLQIAGQDESESHSLFLTSPSYLNMAHFFPRQVTFYTIAIYVKIKLNLNVLMYIY